MQCAPETRAPSTITKGVRSTRSCLALWVHGVAPIYGAQFADEGFTLKHSEEGVCVCVCVTQFLIPVHVSDAGDFCVCVCVFEKIDASLLPPFPA